MSQILGKPGLMMAALAAASLSGLGGSAEVMRPPRTVGYSKPTTHTELPA